jgi:hypothetical protein
VHCSLHRLHPASQHSADWEGDRSWIYPITLWRWMFNPPLGGKNMQQRASPRFQVEDWSSPCRLLLSRQCLHDNDPNWMATQNVPEIRQCNTLHQFQCDTQCHYVWTSQSDNTRGTQFLGSEYPSRLDAGIKRLSRDHTILCPPHTEAVTTRHSAAHHDQLWPCANQLFIFKEPLGTTWE